MDLGILDKVSADRTSRLNYLVSSIMDWPECEDRYEVLLQNSIHKCPACARKAGSYYEATY